MAATLQHTIKASIRWLFQDALQSAAGLTTVSDTSEAAFSTDYSTGTGASLADLIWGQVRTLASSGNDDLDLTALTNTIFGNTVTINFAKVKAILIINTNTVSGDDLVIDTSVTHGATFLTGGASGKVPIPSGAPMLLANEIAGWAVTNGSNDVLRITNNGSHNVTYKIVIIGTSA
jgi:hypothetical protein